MDVVAVAYSGGRDSTALLHATLGAAEAGGWRVAALHVHHGLNPAADDWLAHCEAQCRQWASQGRPVAFVSHRVEERPGGAQSIEAWARDARYAALARLARAQGAQAVLLGHHRRDQAETLLLQALRGGGVAGLAGMPERALRDGIVWLRPWLGRSRHEIDAYVLRHGLVHVDDDSNADPRFARNRLRLAVWPALESAFPQAEAALAASARWAGEADAALAELAAIDLAAIGRAGGLDVARWGALSPARRSLALRVWLRATTGAVASASLIARLQIELPGRQAGRWPAPGGELVAWRGRLGFERRRATPVVREPETGLAVPQPGDYALPGWGGGLRVEPVPTGGVALAALVRLDLRPRGGGETFQAGLGRPPRSLKKQFQAAGVPARARSGPLVFSGGRLVYVPGLGFDARFVGPQGGPRVTLRWAWSGEESNGAGAVATPTGGDDDPGRRDFDSRKSWDEK